MRDGRPSVLIAVSARVRDQYMSPVDLERLHSRASVDVLDCDAYADAGFVQRELGQRLRDVDSLVVSFGAPRIDAELMDRAPDLKIIGDMDGDRFASRIDVEAAWERGIRTVDTTNGSSYPVSEWALALILICLRNAGQHFRRMTLRPTESYDVRADPGFLRGELTGKRVGLIGCGHIGRRLIEFLRPFDTEIWVHDPYLAPEMADVVGFLQTSLDAVLTGCDVIVCLAPHTPATEGMLGQRELDLIPDGRVFVNVSRGVIVDSEALVARLKRGGLIAGLDVFDPEPVGDHEIIHLDNVFLSPHIAGVVASSYTQMFKLMVDELERFFDGHETLFDLTPRSLANRRGSEL
jgi:phosphoglycerate dehydrogenase-like enzyme